VKFGVADAVEYAPMAKNFGLVKDSFPALAVHAPLNDNTFSYRQGRVISSSTVENMLTVILQGQAVSGQVFGDEAPKINGDGGDTVDQGHVEL
jgi:protein disulfide-isomerase A1